MLLPISKPVWWWSASRTIESNPWRYCEIRARLFDGRYLTETAGTLTTAGIFAQEGEKDYAWFPRIEDFGLKRLRKSGLRILHEVSCLRLTGRITIVVGVCWRPQRIHIIRR